MAKIPKLIEMLGALGSKFVPESGIDKGALGEFMNKKIEDARNTPMQRPANINMSPLTQERKTELLKGVMQDINVQEENPFQLFDVEGAEFVTKTLMTELGRATEMPSYDEARKYMNKIQDKYEEFGAGDTEANNLIESVLEEMFMESE